MHTKKKIHKILYHIKLRKIINSDFFFFLFNINTKANVLFKLQKSVSGAGYNTIVLIPTLKNKQILPNYNSYILVGGQSNNWNNLKNIITSLNTFPQMPCFLLKYKKKLYYNPDIKKLFTLRYDYKEARKTLQRFPTRFFMFINTFINSFFSFFNIFFFNTPLLMYFLLKNMIILSVLPILIRQNNLILMISKNLCFTCSLIKEQIELRKPS